MRELGKPAWACGPVAQIPWLLANGWVAGEGRLISHLLFQNPFRRLNKKVKKSKIGY